MENIDARDMIRNVEQNEREQIKGDKVETILVKKDSTNSKHDKEEIMIKKDSVTSKQEVALRRENLKSKFAREDNKQDKQENQDNQDNQGNQEHENQKKDEIEEK